MNWITSLGNQGIRKSYLPWEKSITRKLNYFAFICSLSSCIAIISYTLNGITLVVPELAIGFAALPIVVAINKYLNYNYAVYSFYFISTVVILLLSLQLGEGGEVYVFYFPIIISLLTLCHKSDKIKNVIIISSIIFFEIIINVIGLEHGWLLVPLQAAQIHIVKINTFLLSTLVTILFSIALAAQNNLQEKELTKMIKEKDTLLKELQHRVKNNMSLILGLLNLKLDKCNNEQAKAVLEECNSRIYSMALVHSKLYSGRFIQELNFQEYLQELARELIQTYGNKERINLQIEADGHKLHIDTAIPCGLIVNELVTNSIKYATPASGNLDLKVKFSKNDSESILTFADNGPGIRNRGERHNESLGMVIIESLCIQLEAKFEFKNRNGLEFEMRFKDAHLN